MQRKTTITNKIVRKQRELDHKRLDCGESLGIDHFSTGVSVPFSSTVDGVVTGLLNNDSADNFRSEGSKASDTLFAALVLFQSSHCS